MGTWFVGLENIAASILMPFTHCQHISLIPSCKQHAGVKDCSNWGVSHSGLFHDPRQEELPASQSSGHGLCFPVQTGKYCLLGSSTMKRVLMLQHFPSYTVQAALICITTSDVICCLMFCCRGVCNAEHPASGILSQLNLRCIASVCTLLGCAELCCAVLLCAITCSLACCAVMLMLGM